MYFYILYNEKLSIASKIHKININNDVYDFFLTILYSQ